MRSARTPTSIPRGRGKLFEADARVRFSFHYHSIGEEVVDRTELGTGAVSRKTSTPDKILYSRQLGQAGELDIPAGQVTRHDGYATMYLPGKLTGFQPHMHFLGKRQCLELIYPDSSTEMINCVNFDFNWHIVYNYADEVPSRSIRRGRSCTSSATTTTPRRIAATWIALNWTGGGSRTIDEMAFGWISWFDLTDEEYEKELDVRSRERQRLGRPCCEPPN